MRTLARRLATVGVTGLLAATLLTVVSSSPAQASCTGHGHRDVTTGANIHFNGSGIRIRNGPHAYSATSCRVNGLGYRSHQLNIHCWLRNESNVVWWYLRDNTTGVQGWVRYDKLTGSGVINHC